MSGQTMKNGRINKGERTTTGSACCAEGSDKEKEGFAKKKGGKVVSRKKCSSEENYEKSGGKKGAKNRLKIMDECFGGQESEEGKRHWEVAGRSQKGSDSRKGRKAKRFCAFCGRRGGGLKVP